jgi:hypothetical protein
VGVSLLVTCAVLGGIAMLVMPGRRLSMGLSASREHLGSRPARQPSAAKENAPGIGSLTLDTVPRPRRPVPSARSQRGVYIGPPGSLRPLLPADGPRSDGPSASGVLPKPIDEASSSRQQYEYDIILVHPNDNPGSGLRSQLIEKTEVALRRRTIVSRMRLRISSQRIGYSRSSR